MSSNAAVLLVPRRRLAKEGLVSYHFMQLFVEFVVLTFEPLLTLLPAIV